MPLVQRPTAQHLIWATAAVLCALAQFRMVMLVQGQNYVNSIHAAQGVLDGMPHWRVYQSRLLGPWLVKAFQTVVGDFTMAHVAYAITLTAAAGWLLLHLCHKLYGKQAAWGAFLLFQLLFCFFLGKLWLYAWDHTGIIVFTLFTYFVMRNKDWRWFVALFAVAIFNRESALYIALWMVLDPLTKALLVRQRPQWAMSAIGLVCMGFGLMLIELLRTKLLVKEVGPELFNLPELAGQSFLNQWDTNVAFLHQNLTQFSLGFEFLLPLFLVAVLALAAALAWRDSWRYLGLALTYVLIVASMLAAAAIQETRVMLELLPFVVMGLCALFHEADQSAEGQTSRSS